MLGALQEQLLAFSLMLMTWSSKNIDYFPYGMLNRKNKLLLADALVCLYRLVALLISQDMWNDMLNRSKRISQS